MPLILGTNSIKDTGYDVANSLRFNDGSSDSLTRTPSSDGNRRTFTISLWVKRSHLGTYQNLLWVDPSTYDIFRFDNTDKLRFTKDDNTALRITTRVFRDVSAWYHIVVAVDTTQSTASDRVKMYINGVEETAFDTSADPSLNEQMHYNRATQHWIGQSSGNDQYLDGYISEYCMIDGQQLDPTSFGEFDEDTGIWKPIDVSGLTFGTNGFYLDFENSGSLGADVSGNGNNFTVNNLTAIDQSTDTCTNNFATLNALFPQSNQTLSEGNLKATNITGTYNFRPATIGVSSVKWYAEYKITTNTNHMHGVVDLAFAVAQGQNGYTHCGAGTGGVGYYADGQKYVEDSNSAYGNSYGDGDIIGIALDMDNNAVYFSKNGTFQNSGDPTSGASKTGAISLPTTGTYTFAETVISSCIVECNFGSPAFSISSGNSDGNGYGNFEYAVPSSYYSLCTKNLAEFG